jgi:signal transduction histidine kinase
MSEMLNGLLDYSRVGRKHEMLERVDLRKLALEIASAFPARPGLVIDVAEPWPVIETLRAPIDLVLRNLVENAVKHHDRAVGRVEMSALDSGASLTLIIADDGPGIPPAWHEAIFQPFRRIASDDGVEGSGIGLALVKKTVELVGGRIDVASDPRAQRGTIFRIAWPKVIRV